jgi:hypothetical protein
MVFAGYPGLNKLTRSKFQVQGSRLLGFAPDAVSPRFQNFTRAHGEILKRNTLVISSESEKSFCSRLPEPCKVSRFARDDDQGPFRNRNTIAESDNYL